ncbi:hypothetical protein MP638_006096 [Amoeboaphelidium occidentale]|nr:hypothetical protein MP638_006096 [Amoeboaphelidium occidentale]
MSNPLQRIFGKPLSPDELVKKWRASLKAQERQLDRQIRGIEQEEAKVKRSLKEAAKRGDKSICTSLAKEIVHSRKAKDRIITSKAQLNSITLQLQQQMAQVKIAGSLKKSTEIMKMVNRLVKLPEISKQMEEMSREMMKAGIIEEMMSDAMDNVLDEEDVEVEAEDEVNKVIMEITQGVLGQGKVATGKLPEEQAKIQEELQTPVEEDGDMEARLDALKSL